MSDRINTNTVIITGGLTRDPELYRKPNTEAQGEPVWTVLPLATNRRTANGTRVIYEDVKGWNGLAEAGVAYLHKAASSPSKAASISTTSPTVAAGTSSTPRTSSSSPAVAAKTMPMASRIGSAGRSRGNPKLLGHAFRR